jgi:putative phage-type endonuclease
MLTPDQRARRRRYLGSSDSAALFGLDPYHTATDVYWSKVMHLRDTGTKSTEAGNFLETALLAYAESRVGPIERDVMVVDAGGLLCANLDGRVRGDGDLVECKYDAQHAGDWGQELTDEVPTRVMIQCQHQLLVTGAAVVWVPALILDYRAQFRLYRVDPHAELMEAIRAEGTRFMVEQVAARVPPTNATPPLDVLKQLERAPTSVIEIADDDEAIALWEALAAAREQKRHYEALADDAMARLLVRFGEAEALQTPGGRRLTYFAQGSAPRVDHARLQAQFGEAYTACVTRGTHRVLREARPRR